MSEAQVSVVCCYARADVPYFQALQAHLSGLEQQGFITIWHEGLIPLGSARAQAIHTHLETAALIVFLVSSDLSVSCKTEMQQAMEIYKAGRAQVIPVLVRPYDWQLLSIASLQYLPRDGQPITEWSNQESAWRDVAAEIRRTVEDLSLLSVGRPHSALPPVWNIPYSRNAFFTGRDDLLLRLHTELQRGEIMALSQPQAISGLGGIGKTHVAVEYAYRYAREYEVVLWARAENQETLTSSYNTIATLLKLLEPVASEQEIIIEAVKRWLQTHSKWLLILDNADNLDLLPAYLPSVPLGHILITTRAWDMQRLAQRIEVETLLDEQGTLFLLRRAALIEPLAQLSQVSVEDRELAMQITQELGGLPLALDQAGAYLEATGASLTQYRQVYQHHLQVLLRERRARVPDHPEPVATTWSLSFERVEKQNKASVELLRLCAFLAPDAIPESIITQGAPHLGPLLKPVAADPFRLGQAVEALRAYSLVQRDPRTRTLSVHRLVQAVLRNSMTVNARKQWKQRVVRAVEESSPDVQDIAQWDACEQWLPHAQVCAIWVEQENMIVLEAASLLIRAGYYLKARARYAEAEPLYRCALEIREKQLGGTHPETATGLNNLAELYQTQGKYAEAEPVHRRALEIREKQLGGTHPDTAQSLNNLAELYRVQGKYAKAEPLYMRALKIREEQLGETHPDTAQSLNNLAALYYVQEKYAEAEPLYRRALKIREEQLGGTHPDTAHSLNNLAVLYDIQGKYAEAEPLYRRALKIREEQLGETHPDTAQSLNNLAALYYVQEKYAGVEPLLKRALEIREEQLGGTHPETATSLNNLAELYQTQGKYSEAEPLFRRALEINERVLGTDHPNTQVVQGNYATLLRQLQTDEPLV